MRLALLLICLLLTSAFAGDRKSLLQQPAPEWAVTNWSHSAPLRLQDLRGKVVLVRWWTAPDCPYCRHTAPALNEFHEKYAGRGLQVLGFYHHKGDEPLDVRKVNRYADKFGFKFPIAIDTDWKTLHEWWLDRGDQDFTSVSFLIDRKGVIRHIHPGGEYVKGDKAYATLDKTIQELLAEK